MNNEEMIQEEEFIDVKAIILGYIRFFRRRWYVLLILVILGSGAGFAYAKTSSYSQYRASATYTVEKSSSVITNAELTARLTAGIRTITRTTDFHNEMSETLGMSASGYWISADATEDANLMTVYVTSSDMDLTNNVLEAFAEVYTPWATDLIGSCTITKADENLCTGPTYYGHSVMKMMVLGFAGGTAIWLVIGTLSLLLLNTIRNTKQMAKVTTSTCMGIIPEIKKKKREKSTREPLLMSAKNVNADYLQSMREIRHRLEKRMDGKQVILFTSTSYGEGKSLITLNLAYDLKNHGKKVIVIDADLYHHGIDEFLQTQEKSEGEETENSETDESLKDGKTLLDYMTEEDPLPENLEERLQDFNGVSVLFGNKDRAVDADSLNMVRFEQIVENLKNSADFILIDTPPAGKVGDAILLSDAVDAVWYIVRYNFAEASEVRRGMAPFYRNEKLDGYLLNRSVIEEGSDSYGVSHRYGYGYGYGYGYRSGYGYGYGEKKKGSKKGENTQVHDNTLDW